jgi:hypothetical protein
MNTLRGSITSAALAGLLGFALTGCGTSTDGDTAGGAATTAATTAPADPKAALIASLAALKTGNYALTVDSPETKVTGSVHVPSKSGALKMDVTSEGSSFTMELVGAAPDRWVRISSTDASIQQLLGSDGKTWSHIDTSKITKGGGLDIDVTNADLLGVEPLLQGVTAVKGDGRTITGTIDATKIDAENGFLDDEAIKAMGAAASSLPFTATLDDQGRLSKLVIDAPKAGDTPAGKWTYTISGYGEQKAQTKPAGPIKEMSTKQLQLLNS